MPFVHLVPYALDHGVPPSSAVLLLGMIGVGSTAGRFFLGGLADRVGRQPTLVAMFVGMAFALGIWAVLTGVWWLATFTFVYGVFYGRWVAVLPAVVINSFGGRNVGGLIGILCAGVAFGALISPPTGFAFDIGHTYTLAIWECLASIVGIHCWDRLEGGDTGGSGNPTAMRAPKTVRSAEAFGRVRLSRSFFMRDFLYSEIADVPGGLTNLPDDPELAVAAGRCLCGKFPGTAAGNLRSSGDPLVLSVTGGERPWQRTGFNCAANQRNFARHIWDRRSERGIGAVACIVIPWLVDRMADGASWQAMAWWVHDHLPYSELQFFPKLAAFQI